MPHAYAGKVILSYRCWLAACKPTRVKPPETNQDARPAACIREDGKRWQNSILRLTIASDTEAAGCRGDLLKLVRDLGNDIIVSNQDQRLD